MSWWEPFDALYREVYSGRGKPGRLRTVNGVRVRVPRRIAKGVIQRPHPFVLEARRRERLRRIQEEWAKPGGKAEKFAAAISVAYRDAFANAVPERDWLTLLLRK